MSVTKTDRICVVGAGPAGLSTAHRLRQSGYEHVTVLEKQPLVGGLCITYEFEGKAFDLGANYVTSAYKRVRSLAKEVGAELYTETDASFFDRTTDRYQSILKTAQGDNGLFSFGWKCLRYLMKRRRLNSVLRPDGYGEIHEHPSLLCTFEEWLEAQGLADLSTLFEIPITLMGYGRLDEIPASYALTYMRVRTVLDLMIFGSMPIHFWPKRFVRGFQRFWESVAEPLDVRTDVQITSVRRSSDGVTVDALVPQRVGADTEHAPHTFGFDQIVLCCPLQLSVTAEFLDLTDVERDLFERITLNPFCVTTFAMERSAEFELHTRLVNITPVPARTSAQPTIITQQFKGNPLVTFYTPVVASDDVVEADVIAGIRSLAAEVGINLPEQHETWDNFPYFPQVSVSDIAAGWYHRLEGLQGLNRTFYNGGIMAFELIEPIVEYSDALVERHFVGGAS